MSKIEHQREVDRPIEVAWDVWSDVRLLPELSKSTTEVREAPERLTATGQSFRQVVQAAGRCWDVPWTVTSFERLDHLTIEGKPGFGVTLALTEAVLALDDDRTRLTLSIDYRLPFGPLGRVASKLGIEQLATREAREVLEGVARMIERRPVGSGPRLS